MDKEKEIKHRDIQRMNKANKAVQGCAYSDINKSCLNTLIKHSKGDGTFSISPKNVGDLLQIAKESNDKAKLLLVASQNNIAQQHCKTYASSQVSQLQLMHKNKEDINDVKSISRYIIQDNMVTMTKNVFNIDQSGKYSYCMIMSHHFDQLRYANYPANTLLNPYKVEHDKPTTFVFDTD